MQQYYTVADMAERLGAREDRVRALLREHDIYPPICLGGLFGYHPCVLAFVSGVLKLESNDNGNTDTQAKKADAG